VGFEASINPYRGCEHGCIYCYARPTHEYLGFSSGLDFETKIMVKEDAPKLLRAELSSEKWQPKVLAMSGVTDPYQPIERRLKITRGCLEVLTEFSNPVCIITKNQLVTRDIDLLGELARHQASAVFISLTTLDTALRKVMEPRTAPPAARLATITALSRAGIPVGVLVAPVIPGLTDHEIPSLLDAAAEAGARFAGHVTLRLPHAVAPLFEQWLENHFPEKKDKILNRLRALRGGKLYDAQFGKRMRGEGIFAEQMDQMFAVACRKAGIASNNLELSTAAFRRPLKHQLELFG
jgi:DNA repair photolyase